MSGECPNCGTYQAKISQLMGGIAGTAAVIAAELEEPTMSRYQLLLLVKDRLLSVLSSAY